MTLLLLPILCSIPLFRERELPPRFAEPSSLDYQLALQWKNLFANESQRLNALSDASRAAHEQLLADLSAARLEHQAQLLRQGEKLLAHLTFACINGTRRVPARWAILFQACNTFF